MLLYIINIIGSIYIRIKDSYQNLTRIMLTVKLCKTILKNILKNICVNADG